MVALVGCGSSRSGASWWAWQEKWGVPPWVALETEIRNEIKNFSRATLTEADYERVTELTLSGGEGQRGEISDAVIKELAKLPLSKLKELAIFDSPVTDAGLKEVATMKQLTEIDLQNLKVTKAGIAELQKALPKCKIYHDFE